MWSWATSSGSTQPEPAADWRFTSRYGRQSVGQPVTRSAGRPPGARNVISGNARTTGSSSPVEAATGNTMLRQLHRHERCGNGGFRECNRCLYQQCQQQHDRWHRDRRSQRYQREQSIWSSHFRDDSYRKRFTRKLYRHQCDRCEWCRQRIRWCLSQQLDLRQYDWRNGNGRGQCHQR
jgi:hypothetical protein